MYSHFYRSLVVGTCSLTVLTLSATPFNRRFYSQIYSHQDDIKEKIESITYAMSKGQNDYPSTFLNYPFRIEYMLGSTKTQIVLVVRQSILSWLYWGDGRKHLPEF